MDADGVPIAGGSGVQRVSTFLSIGNVILFMFYLILYGITSIMKRYLELTQTFSNTSLRRKKKYILLVLTERLVKGLAQNHNLATTSIVISIA